MDANISINGQVAGTINFAMQQNYIPVIRRLVFTNQGQEELDGLRVRISFEPEFAHVFEAQLPKLTPGTPVELSPVRLVMHGDYLFSLTERMEGNIRIRVMQEETCLHEECISIRTWTLSAAQRAPTPQVWFTMPVWQPSPVRRMCF